MKIKKTINIALIIILFLMNFGLVFAAPPTSSSPSSGSGSADTAKKSCTWTLATDPSECGSKTIECKDDKGTVVDKRPNTTPRNCLFLEEPIGGKKGWDLYKVTCKEEQSKQMTCTTQLWRGEPVYSSKGERGPIQALLTEDKSKAYQGPFTLLYNYLDLIYKYMSGLIVGISVLYVVIGGVKMTTSYGDPTKFDKGKGYIIRAVEGIIVWFTASLILYTINPTFFAF